MNNPVLETLTTARKLLSDPNRWTSGANARDRNGNPVGVADPAACRWCAVGAVYGSTTDLAVALSACTALWHASMERHDNAPISTVSDKMGWAYMLGIFERAISREKERETREKMMADRLQPTSAFGLSGPEGIAITT